MSSPVYSNRQAAIEAEILPLLKDKADNYNISDLADRTLSWIPDGYGISYFLDHDSVDFWAEAAHCLYEPSPNPTHP